MDYRVELVIDSREKRNEYIIEALKRNNIDYAIRKLDFGDYSAQIYFRDGRYTRLDRCFCFERKRELTELSNTIYQGIDRFESEMKLASIYTTHKKLIIEDIDYYKNILKHNYRTQLPPKLFLKRLYELQNKYNIEIVAVDERLTASYIYRYICMYIEDNIEQLYRKAKKIS